MVSITCKEIEKSVTKWMCWDDHFLELSITKIEYDCICGDEECDKYIKWVLDIVCSRGSVV